MTENLLVDDSQPEDLLDLSLSWDYVNKEKERSTRKAKQLDKLHKDLQPLNKEFEGTIPTRARNSSFHKNNQFTVVAAEFLNLSTKSELDQLFEDGFSKDEIESMLEQKYQEKKNFYTDLNVKNHKFKRKSFESWRSMSNSHSVTTNTFTSEEEFISQISKPQQLRLKRINNMPLKKFYLPSSKKQQTTGNATNSKKGKVKQAEEVSEIDSPFHPQPMRIARQDIPNEAGLLGVSSETDTDVQNSSLLILGESNDLKGFAFGNIEPKNVQSLPPESPEAERSVNSSPKIIRSDKLKFLETNSDITNHDSQLPNTQAELLDIFSEKKDTTTISSDQINDEPRDTPIQLPSSPGKIPDIPTVSSSEVAPANSDVNDNILSHRRNLRHRTIVNRNPYLVDRAEYLGLSTKYELIFMTEEGKSDDEILRFLDSKYQKRRKERKDKEVGFGPFSKLTFYDIMNSRNQVDAVSENINTDSLVGSYEVTADNSNSDQEFALSMDEQSEDDNDDLGDENIWNEIDKPQEQESEAVNLEMQKTVKPLTQSENCRFNLNEISFDADTTNFDGKTQKGKRRQKHSTFLKPFKKRKSLNDIVTTRASANQVNLSEPFSPRATFNPYSMNFLTLSDEETPDLKAPNDSKKGVRSPKQSEHGSNITASFSKDKKSVVSTLSGKFNVQAIKEIPSNTVMHQKNTELSSANKDAEKRKADLHKQKSSGNIFYHASDRSNYIFNRNANIGTYQEEVVKPLVLAQDPEIPSLELNLDFAKNTGLRLKQDQPNKNPETNTRESSKLLILWDKYQDTRNLNKQRYKFLINLKPLDYKSLKVPQSFLNSALLAKSLSENDFFYRSKPIKIDFLSTKMTFEMPLKAESTLSQLRAFHDILLGALKSNSFHKQQIKQLRKCLIQLLMILSNIKHDCPAILPQVGMEMNSFLNRYKKNVTNNEMVFCIFASYFLVYMKMFQKFLPISSEFSSSFKNTESWLSKKIVQHICNLSFEKIFLYPKSVLLESLHIFLKCTSNPWSYVGNLAQATEFDVLNVLNFLYFCNSYHSVEMDWEFFTTTLTNYCDKVEKQSNDSLSIKNLFASVLKLNRELKWELEDHLVVKMFRLLAEYKFDNTGALYSEKPTIYPNIPATDALTDSDGCLDIYFKILNIYTKQYLSENTKSLVERLIPIRSTSGYSPVQLQNRAKVLLMMVYSFDQDLSSSLESILNDMIRNGSLYSLKSSFALIRTIIRQTPRRPYNLVRKYLPLLISKINHLQPDREVFSIFKDLIFTVNELLNGQDISHLKRMIDFLGIILKFKYADNDNGFEVVINKSFLIISQQYEFLNGVEISEKDEIRLKRSLQEVSKNAKMRLLDENAKGFAMNRLYIKLWLYAGAKTRQPAIQLLYTEWNYFGNKQLRDKYELTFFTYLVQSFDVSTVKEEVLTVFFRHLAFLFTDLSSFYRNLVNQNLIMLKKDDHHFTNQCFQFKRIEITIQCLSSLFRENDEKMIYHVLQSFIVSLKGQLVNHEAKNFIKEVGLYLYTVANDRFDIPEWDYLVNKLKLETVEGSLSKKIQFVETVDETIFLLEKIYIASIAGNTYEDFRNQFLQLSKMQVSGTNLVLSLCGIVSFHVECILKLKSDHWAYLLHWMVNLRSYVIFQTCKQDLLLICQVFRNLSKLNTVYASNCKYRYYYLTALQNLYELLEWSLTIFWGFDDFKLFASNFWLFAGMDPVVDHTHSASVPISPVISSEQEVKLWNLYQTSNSILEGKIKNEYSEKDLYELESELKQRRSMLIKRWKLPKFHGSFLPGPPTSN